MKRTSLMKRHGYVWLPENYKKRPVYGTEPDLKQGRVVCSYQGTDKQTSRAFGVKYKVLSAPPSEWKKCSYLTFSKPRIVSQTEHRREIEYIRWDGKKWNKRGTISYRVGSKWWYWWT